MPVFPPNGLVLISTGVLDGVFRTSSAFRSSMEQLANESYMRYLAVLNLSTTYKEFWDATFNLTYTLKQGFDFHVTGLGVESIQPLLPRIQVCCYVGADQTLFAHFDLMPENVNSVHYMHIPFTDLKH